MTRERATKLGARRKKNLQQKRGGAFVGKKRETIQEIRFRKRTKEEKNLRPKQRKSPCNTGFSTQRGTAGSHHKHETGKRSGNAQDRRRVATATKERETPVGKIILWFRETGGEGPSGRGER